MKKIFTLLFIAGITAFISCQNNNSNKSETDKSKVSDSLSPEEFADKTALENEFKNAEELNFALKKISQFRKLIKNNTESEDIKKQASKLSKDLLKGLTLNNWSATLTEIDVWKQTNADITLVILDKWKAGERIITKNGEDTKFDSRITLYASQSDVPKKGYKGISRNSKIYEKIGELGTPCRVLFSAKIIDITEFTEKTGINLETNIIIELTDIKRAEK